MRETRLDLTGTCSVILTEWDSIPADLCIQYVERQNDTYYSNAVTEVDIDADAAAKIMALLVRAFPHLTPTPHAGGTDA